MQYNKSTRSIPIQTEILIYESVRNKDLTMENQRNTPYHAVLPLVILMAVVGIFVSDLYVPERL